MAGFYTDCVDVGCGWMAHASSQTVPLTLQCNLSWLVLGMSWGGLLGDALEEMVRLRAPCYCTRTRPQRKPPRSRDAAILFSCSCHLP